MNFIRRLRARLSAQFDRLSSGLATLSGRERRLVVAAAVVLIAFFAFLVTHVFSNRADAVRARTLAKARQIEEIAVLSTSYDAHVAAQKALEAKLASSNIRLISFLDERAQKARVELQSQNPRPDVALGTSRIVESSVEVTLTDVKINRLYDFLSSIEDVSDVVKLKYLRIEPRAASATVTAWLTVATYHLK